MWRSVFPVQLSIGNEVDAHFPFILHDEVSDCYCVGLAANSVRAFSAFDQRNGLGPLS